MNTCKKCQKEIIDTEHYLFNTHCKECWTNITPEECKSLPGFCPICGDGWSYVQKDGTKACLNCYRQIHGARTFPEI